jgi:hypothetical protein
MPTLYPGASPAEWSRRQVRLRRMTRALVRRHRDKIERQLREEFVRRSGAANLDEALATTMTSVVPLLRQTLGSRKCIARSPK